MVMMIVTMVTSIGTLKDRIPGGPGASPSKLWIETPLSILQPRIHSLSSNLLGSCGSPLLARAMAIAGGICGACENCQQHLDWERVKLQYTFEMSMVHHPIHVLIYSTYIYIMCIYIYISFFPSLSYSSVS